MAAEALDEVLDDGSGRFHRIPATLVLGAQGEADLSDPAVLVQADIEITDELPVALDADLSRLTGLDVRPGARDLLRDTLPAHRQIPVLERGDGGIVAISDDDVDVVLAQRPQEQPLGPEGVCAAHPVSIRASGGSGQRVSPTAVAAAHGGGRMEARAATSPKERS